jgi:hypothetical protein
MSQPVEHVSFNEPDEPVAAIDCQGASICPRPRAGSEPAMPVQKGPNLQVKIAQ